MNELLSALLPYLFYVVGSVLGVVCIWAVKQYLIPWLKQKLSSDQYAALKSKVMDLMASAESKFELTGAGQTKKEWVINQLTELGIEFDETYVGNLIDGFVKTLTAEGILNTDEKEETEKESTDTINTEDNTSV